MDLAEKLHIQHTVIREALEKAEIASDIVLNDMIGLVDALLKFIDKEKLSANFALENPHVEPITRVHLYLVSIINEKFKNDNTNT